MYSWKSLFIYTHIFLLQEFTTNVYCVSNIIAIIPIYCIWLCVCVCARQRMTSNFKIAPATESIYTHFCSDFILLMILLPVAILMTEWTLVESFFFLFIILYLIFRVVETAVTFQRPNKIENLVGYLNRISTHVCWANTTTTTTTERPIISFNIYAFFRMGPLK